VLHVVTDRCTVPRCHAEADLFYLGRGLCETHWNELAAEDAPPDALRMVLGVETNAPTAMEEAMTEKTEAATGTVAQEDPMSTKQKTTRSKKKSAKAQAAKKAATPKAKREKIPAENLMTFAVRLPKSDSAAFHAAAGAGRASKVARRLLVAFATEDEAAFRAVVEETRERRS
jgi:hypothetical protein